MSRMFTILPATYSAPWLGIAVAAIIAAWAALSPDPARAYEEMIGLDCDQDSVVEGQTYRFHIYRRSDSGWWHETMKVFWSTQSGSATEKDYTPLHHEGQASNGFQTRVGRMGRTFHTTEDSYSEVTETFTIRAINASDESDEALTCPMKIQDDDGPGAYETRFDTVPGHGRGWYDIKYGPDQGQYRTNENIRVKLRFTEAVMVQGGDVTIGLRVGDEDADTANRVARFVSGSGSDTLIFEYQVGPTDLDLDGISIPHGEFGGEGKIFTVNGWREANRLYPGTGENSDQKVMGITSVRDVNITSNPSSGDTYRRGEEIEVAVRFSKEVQVNGSVHMRLKVGDGPGFLEQAPYHRGSGTDTLVFRYTVDAMNLDATGITVAPGVSDPDERNGILGTGSIVFVQGHNEHPVYIAYEALINQAQHKVDGRAYIKSVAITSTPGGGQHYTAGEAILVGLTFDQPVSIEPKPAIVIEVGDKKERAPYHGGESTDTLVFRYEVDDDDVDHDGLSVPQQNGFKGSGRVREAGAGSKVNERIPNMAHQPAHRVNGALPTVVSNEIISDPETGDTYRLDETIEIGLTFDGAVDVVAQPSVRIRLDGTEDAVREAVYRRGSGTSTLIFEYVVRVADLDRDGLELVDRHVGGFGGHGHVYRAGTQESVTGHIPGFSSAQGHRVDGRPRLAEVATTSAPASDGVYRAGETISVALTFDQPVVSDGAPSIALEIGDHLAEATYRSGSGSDTIVFGYDVDTHDRDDDGFALPARVAHGFGDSGIYSSGGEIEVDVEYAGFGDQGGHAVAGQAHVQLIFMGSDPGDDGAYEPGDTIEVWVQFDDDLTVVGNPQLSLDLGGSDVLASFASVGSLSQDGATLLTAQDSGNVLVFAYEVEVGESDSDGITILRNGLSLHGGSILDSRGNELNLLHEAATFPSHRVGVVAPAFVSARTSNDGEYVILEFTENVHVRSDLRTVGMFTGVDASTYLRALIDVLVDGHRAHTHDAEISGVELTLVMDSPIRSGQEVNVAYDDVFARDLPGLLVDADGNPLVHFGPQVVTNNSTMVDDGDEQWPLLSAYSLTIAEGGTAAYTVTLGSQPDQEVTVSLSISPSSGLTASPASLTFTPDNWAGRQTVDLTAEADDDSLNAWHEIIHSADVAGFIVGHLKVLTEDE